MHDARRVLLLFPSQSYRVDAFVASARRIGAELVLATDLPLAFRRHGFRVVGVDLRAPVAAADELARALSSAPPAGVIGTNETSAIVAALVAERMNLPHSRPEAVYAARNKRLMRELLGAARVPSPSVLVLEPDRDPRTIAGAVRYPCVVKPPMLTGSQGVIRADGPDALERAVHRVRAILARHSSDASGDPDFHRLLVEDYLPGREVSVEAIVTNGRLEPLAIFDKPDELSGPFFEETLYVTPSRLPETTQARILQVTADAASAMGLSHGPLHAELRTTGEDAAVIEIAARSIGGLCSRVFELAAGSLEDLLLAHALGAPLPHGRTGATGAAGVMMMPIPRSGVLRSVAGVDEARAVPGIEDVSVAIQPGESIRALPEGGSYLGFIFARADTPDAVEQALRKAHSALRFDLAPLLDVAPM